MFCALAQKIHYFTEKINLFIALGPIIKIETCCSGILKKFKENAKLEKDLEKGEIWELLPAQGRYNKGASFMTKNLPEITSFGIRALIDDEPKEVN